jgi:hypothetical protein
VRGVSAARLSPLTRALGCHQAAPVSRHAVAAPAAATRTTQGRAHQIRPSSRGYPGITTAFLRNTAQSEPGPRRSSVLENAYDGTRARRHGELPEPVAPSALGSLRGLSHVPARARHRGSRARRKRHRIRPHRARHSGQPCGAFHTGVPDQGAGRPRAFDVPRQDSGTQPEGRDRRPRLHLLERRGGLARSHRDGPARRGLEALCQRHPPHGRRRPRGRHRGGRPGRAPDHRRPPPGPGG